MSVKYHDVNPLGGDRKHVSIGLEYTKLKTEIALDIQCPSKIAESLPKPLIAFLEGLATSDAGPTVKRSKDWAKLAKKLIDAHPYCSLCGNKNRQVLIPHHITPVWIDPKQELDEDNIIILCEKSEVLSGLNCHLTAAHLGNFRLWNPRIREVCEDILPMAFRMGEKK
ncbi:hypothetical protein UFOVP785_3 [uncultured Caudovirales phage]|uniref:HNHc domain containing protein n=1 Tax=uncultured Caudovirales phage TaxID=2100421 RepID=A0A6J5NXE0_9CAUD|nr:hypothetical protein UFOVP785_3 [uncultured Caudovirales phage]